MADVGDFTTWSSTAASNQPQGSTVVGSGLDENLRAMQAEVAKWRDGTGYGVLMVTGVAGTANAITGNTSPAPTLAANQKFLLIPTATNTAATTLALNGGAAKNIYAANSALVGGELHANIPIVLEYDGTQLQSLGPVFRQPTLQTFLSGSGTYTTPVGATRIKVRMAGGGGGGAGTGGSFGAGSNGADTTFGTLTAAKGTGAAATPGSNGTGGVGTNGDINLTGGDGGQGGINTSSALLGPNGGANPLGGAGMGGHEGNAGGAAKANTGGGGGAGGKPFNVQAGGGGGAGAYVEKLIVGPSATYSYAVGTGGAGGAAGSSGFAGAAGGSGIITVDEWYD